MIIAAAGGAAHLAGVVAAHTTLPVIGMPVPTAELGGLDSLLSTVQMPGDVPVATVAVGMGGPRNAGLLAVQILALADESLADTLRRIQAGAGTKRSPPRTPRLQEIHPRTMPTNWETLRWQGDRGRSTRPARSDAPARRIREVTCRDVGSVWEAIKMLRVRGAPAIGIAAAYGVVLGTAAGICGRPQHVPATVLDQVSRYLASSRPTAVNLFWALRADARPSTRSCAGSTTPAEIHAALLDEARAIHEEDRRICRAIGTPWCGAARPTAWAC